MSSFSKNFEQGRFLGYTSSPFYEKRFFFPLTFTLIFTTIAFLYADKALEDGKAYYVSILAVAGMGLLS